MFFSRVHPLFLSKKIAPKLGGQEKQTSYLGKLDNIHNSNAQYIKSERSAQSQELQRHSLHWIAKEPMNFLGISRGVLVNFELVL